jgi:serpin B
MKNLIFIIFLSLIQLIYSYFSKKFIEAIFSSEEYKYKNIAISPIAVYKTLAHLANGSKGKTLSEIFSLLEIYDLIKIDERILHIYNEFLKFRGFKCVNSLYSKYSINKNFLGISRNYGIIDKIQSIEEINKQVSEKTNNQITDLINNNNIQLSNVSLIALNAVSLKIELLYKFNKKYNQLIKFLDSNDHLKIVQVMIDQRSYDYLENNLFKLIKIEFMEHINGYFILPKNKDISLIDCYNSLFKNQNDIKELNFKLRLKKLLLKIPKFKIDFEIKLKSILESMGLSKIFEKSAELDNISSGFNMNLNDILHRVVIEFDEIGLTDNDINFYLKHKKDPILIIDENCDYEEIIFNRPFFYIVTYSDLFGNSDILTIGKIEDVEL